MPVQARILDAGTGSGRDLREFSKLGFNVLGLDSSISLAKLAEEYSGEKVIVGSFKDIDYIECFEGIWACASLLHFPKSELTSILKKFHDALVCQGVLFMSVREGTGNKKSLDGRYFQYYSKEELSEIVSVSGFVIESIWVTEDVIAKRHDRSWINLVGTKKI